jgi:molybdopterin molybdotransferase
MTQLTHDCFAAGRTTLTLGQALDLIDRRVLPVVGTETVGLRRARGRILAEDIVSTTDVPPHDNAAVDGWAVRHADLAADAETRLPVAGRAAAGHPWTETAGKSCAIRIFTGAPMPNGFDTVFMQEDCRTDGGHVILPPGITPGANRRRSGEDVRAGSVVLSCGRRLQPQDIGLAAAIGRADLPVRRPLRAAVFSTGDELGEPGRPLPPGGIYDSNRHALIALLEGLGVEVDDLGILEDRYEAIRDALDRAAAGRDLVVTSGGMSVGEEDHVKAAVEALGRLHLWQLAIKPGRPIGLGRIGTVPFVGLPGNPVAMVVTFLRIARPMILRLAGAAETAPPMFTVRADFAMRKKTGRREWIRVHLVDGEGGLRHARKFPREGSGILSSLVDSHGLVELGEEMSRVENGMEVPFIPFAGLL